ncbi:MAG: TerB family tellurite resistance protein [Myxococcota bacterium]
MSMLDPNRPHPARDLDADDRRTYATAVASLAFADEKLHDAEVDRLGLLMEALGIDAGEHDGLVEAARGAGAEAQAAWLGRWRDTDVATALLEDSIVLAFSDQELDARESAHIARIASTLGVDPGRAMLVARHVLVESQDERTRGEPTNPKLVAELGDDLAHSEPPKPGPLQRLLTRLRG